MSAEATTEQTKKVSDDAPSPAPISATGTAAALESPVPASAMMVPMLGSGSGSSADSKASPGSDGLRERKRAQADPRTSGEILTELAKPKIFPGPDIELQRTIVTALEKAIPAIDAGSKAARDAATEAGHDLDRQLTAKKIDGATHRRLKDKAKREAPNKVDIPLLYVGSIVLTGVPADPADDAKFFQTARLVPTDHALGEGENAPDLPEKAGVEREIVFNTLMTMRDAGQLDYLRKSGIMGADWQVVVEIHYYRSRAKSSANLHKDTLGQTMFVNLNYTNEEEMAGPEWVTNPPLVQTHEDKLATTLPGQFRADLEQTRGIGDPTTIETGVLPRHGVAAFVDETIHHSTPHLGHRSTNSTKLKDFLSTDPELRPTYEAAKAAWDASHPTGMFARLRQLRPFTMLYKGDHVDVWEQIMEMFFEKENGAKDIKEVKLERPALRRLTFTDDQIDRLLSSHAAGDAFRSVNIPARARTNEQSGARVPLTSPTSGGKPITLKRAMSQRALAGTMPPETDGPRRFFRTWVRAVPIKKSAPSTSPVSGSGTETTTPTKPPPVMKAASVTDTAS
jgi:hypothetical protein